MQKNDLLGKKVRNKANEIGVVRSVDEVAGRLDVEFDDRSLKLQYPKAFWDGFLLAEDDNLQDELLREAEIIRQKVAKDKELKRLQEQEQAKLEAESRGKRGSHKDILTKGERFRTHAEALNECFGYSYKHYQQAFKRIDDQYAVWFPSIAKRVMGEFLAADTSYGWLNTLCENDTVIYEKNVEDINMNSERDRFWDVFVFSKKDGEDEYVFTGLFRSNPVPTDKGFRYEKLGSQIDLNTMQILK